MKNNGIKTAFFFVVILCVIMSACSVLILIDYGIMSAGMDGAVVCFTLGALPLVLVICVIVLFAMVDNQELIYPVKR